MIIGGQTVTATSIKVATARIKAKSASSTTSTGKGQGNEMKSMTRDRNANRNNNDNKTKAEMSGPAPVPSPIYSGDKLIPERFAECKRVPKIPNAAAGSREYAKDTLSKTTTGELAKPLLVEMLGELMRLQKRVMEENHAAANAAANGGGNGAVGKTTNAKARRRLVMGLREVARGIRAHTVKMVIMANNLDQSGAIDEKLQEIIDLAHKEDVPLFYEFTKRTLGKAIGKSIKIEKKWTGGRKRYG